MGVGYRILIVHNRYQQAGGERAAVDAQIALLRSYGHTVLLYQRDNVEIEQFGLLQKAQFFPNTVFCRRTYQEVRALVTRQQPDVAHIHNIFPLISPAVYQALQDADVPVVQTLHNFRFLCPNALFYVHGKICERCKFGNTLHAIRLKCYRDSYPLSAVYALSIGLHRHRGTFQGINRFIALTGFSAEKLLESGLAKKEQMAILGNFVPDPLPAVGSHRERAPYIVYLGRLAPEKGIDVLIKAMIGIDGLRLKIIGDGPLAVPLSELAQSQGMTNVQFLGRVVGNSKWNILRNALALVLPSVCYENFPMTVIESLAVGTPVVVSNLGSLPYIVQDGHNGLLFEAASPESLRDKLLWLAAHPEQALKMGQAGRQMVEKKYTAAVHYRQLINIYKQVMQ